MEHRVKRYFPFGKWGVGMLATMNIFYGCTLVPFLGKDDITNHYVDANTWKLGRKIFQTQCMSCHPEVSDGTGMSFNGKPRPSKYVKWIIRNGGWRTMPSFPRDLISDQELSAVVVYVETLQGK